MKKTYIEPVIETINISMQQILTISFNADDATGTGFLNDESADEGVEAMSRELFGF